MGVAGVGKSTVVKHIALSEYMYEPEDVDIVLPKDFHIEQEGGLNDAFVPIE